jgi:electron transfer flavoprotein alpha subunit
MRKARRPRWSRSGPTTDADFADAPKEVIMQDQAGGVLPPEADLFVVSGGRGMKGPENWNLIGRQ